jgi:TPR repeat protein
MTYLAGAYHNGWYGLSKSDKKAMKLHKRAAELGNWHAMAQLADLYMEGEGVKLNPKKAKELFRTAADKGVAMAQISLGKLYYDAEPPLYGEAYRYFKMAADQGRTDAEHCVGVCYIYGQGVEKDLDEAERWFTRAAAEKGIGEAEKWYRSKRGTDTSRDVAKVSLAKLAKLREREAVNAKWRPKLQKLAANGDEKAIAALEELERA